MITSKINVDMMARLIVEKTGSADAKTIGNPSLPKATIDRICRDKVRRGVCAIDSSSGSAGDGRATGDARYAK